jgi:hypothetical protein
LVLSPDEGFAQQEYEFSLKSNTDALLNGLRGINLKDDVNGSCQDDATECSDEKRSEELAAEFADILASSVKAAVDIHVALEGDIPKDVSNELKDIPRMYHPLLLTQRVKVPTVVCIVSFQILQRECNFEMLGASFRVSTMSSLSLNMMYASNYLALLTVSF